METIKTKNYILTYYSKIPKSILFFIFLGIFFSISPVIISIFYPIYLGKFLDMLSIKGRLPLNILYILISIFFVTFLFKYLGDIIRTRASFKASLSLRSKIFDSFLFLPKNIIKEKGESYFSRIINEDISQSMNIFQPYIYRQILDVIRFFPILIIVFMIDPLASLFFILILIASTMSYLISQKLLPRKHKAIFEKLGKVLSFITESLNVIPILKNNKYLDIRSQEHTKISASINSQYNRVYFIQFTVESFLSNLPAYTIRILLLVYLAVRIINSKITIGNLITVLTYYAYCEYPLSLISNISAMISSIKGNIQRILEYFTFAEKIKIQKTPINFIHRTKTDFFIKINDLNISYENKIIINNLSHNFDYGKITGAVGLSGIGKSTLVDCFTGIKNDYSGKIYFLNTDYEIRQYDTNDHINYFNQDALIINASLQANIIMGNKDNPEIYESILHDLNLNSFRKNDFGYNGAFLSGGEKQKISTARFLYNFIDKNYFIIDEPFISLDEITKELYIETLKKYVKDKTGIIISHDLKVLLSLVDDFIILENGTITQTGTHDQLYNSPGLYKDIYTSYAKLKTGKN